MSDTTHDVETCPRPGCGIPIPDTAYVCTRCASILSVALRNAAANWDELEAAVARQSAISGDSGSATTPRTLHGPTDIPCQHGSCLTVRQSQLRAMWAESPIPGEKNLISFAAHEDAWIVTNTATTWARLVEEETGRRVPAHGPSAPIKGEPLRVVVPARRQPQKQTAPSPTLCDYSWIPLAFCACGHPHPEAS